MASDSENEILEDVDAICGWGAADFDDELDTQARRKAVGKVAIKRKPQKTLSNSKSATGVATLRNQAQHFPDSKLWQDKQIEKPLESSVKQPQQRESSSKEDRPHRKTKPKLPHEAKEQSSPKPSPRTLSLKGEHAAIAASGRERRMRIVAAAIASNVSRRSGIASVVSASFDGDSDEEQEEQEMMSRRQNEEWVPSSAPQNQLQIKLPRVSEPSTAPAGRSEIPKKMNPPLPLPLLSIKPGCGGNETRLLGKGAPSPDAPRHWRRHRQQKSSLLPSRDVSDNWESNFSPALRRSRSPIKYHRELPQASNSSVSSFTKAVRVPLAPRQKYLTPFHFKELSPSVHHTGKESDLAAGTVKTSDTPPAVLNNALVAHREEKEDDDDESWTECYDDPEILAKSMAGLIQALSTFAADVKHSKASKAAKNKRRRAKLPHPQQQVPPNPPVLRLPPPGEINVTSGRARISEGRQESKPSARRRKHRKLRNKPSDNTNLDTKNQVHDCNAGLAGVSRENTTLPNDDSC